jgi:hypothetical protein
MVNTSKNGSAVVVVNSIIAFCYYPNINSIESSENYIRAGIEAVSINFKISLAVI